MTAEDPAKSSVFAIGMNIREVNSDTLCQPTAPAAIEVSRITYGEIVTDDHNFQKAILPEYLDYYTTTLLWCRIVALKRANQEVLTLEEEQLLRLIEHTTFSVPDPIFYQLKIFGRIQTVTREHLRPTFPALPTQQVGGYGGYYGAISPATHNNYEELPCPGVLAEAVRQSVSDAAPGPYQSSLQAEGIIPNQNLLGFRPLANRRNEAKNLAFDANITGNQFPETIPNTGINIVFMTAISGILAQTKTFKLNAVNFHTMTDSGSLVQAVMQKEAIGSNQVEKLGELTSYGLFKEQDSLYGMGIAYIPNLYKMADTLATANQWCCIQAPTQPYYCQR